MALNVGYFWTVNTAEDFLNNLITAGSQNIAAIAGSPGGTRYFGAWTDSSNTADLNVRGRLVDGIGGPVADEFMINSTTTNNQAFSKVAGLNDSTWVVTFSDGSTDPGGDIRFRRFDFNGNALGADVPVAASGFPEVTSDVTALADGGFAIAFHRGISFDNTDIHVQRFNADGTPNGGLIPVDTDVTMDTVSPSIAGLVSGGFVVAWTLAPGIGPGGSVWFQRYDAAGTPIDGHVLVDGLGAINNQIQVAALQDGGFVVAYRENSWDPTGSDITVQFYHADGTARSGHIRVNDNDVTAADESSPSLTVLSNGFVVVGWEDGGGRLMQQAYDPDGFPAGTNYLVAEFANQGEIAALTSDLVAEVHSSAVKDSADPNTFSMRHSIHALSPATVRAIPFLATACATFCSATAAPTC
jgi:hypothetical protein